MPFFKRRHANAHARHDEREKAPHRAREHAHQHSRITFFGGKGGVGKTTCSTAYALLFASAGRRTLLVSTDPAHSLGDLLESDIKDEPKQIIPNLWVREVNPENAAKEYLDEVRKNLRRLASPHLWEEVERQLDLAMASPGADESALFDELVRLIVDTDGHYDHVVFDTAPTGHTLRLLTLPELMGVWIEGMLLRREKMRQANRMWNNMVGVREETTDPVYQQLLRRKNMFAQARHILLDTKQTTFYFVINPEQLPILETAKAIRILAKYHMTAGGIVVNRVLPKEADGAFLAERREQEAVYLQMIEDQFQGLKKIFIPLRARDIRGLEGVQWVAEQMKAQLGELTEITAETNSKKIGPIGPTTK